mmetsp:Transcript_25914/g.61183  ORF Transcript_25914/g.61183 Transcript_25914/m.61183 type:complete len:226 (+) Transcript_25914:1465-2142(+)
MLTPRPGSSGSPRLFSPTPHALWAPTPSAPPPLAPLSSSRPPLCPRGSTRSASPRVSRTPPASPTMAAPCSSWATRSSSPRPARNGLAPSRPASATTATSTTRPRPWPSPQAHDRSASSSATLRASWCGATRLAPSATTAQTVSSVPICRPSPTTSPFPTNPLPPPALLPPRPSRDSPPDRAQRLQGSSSLPRRGSQCPLPWLARQPLSLLPCAFGCSFVLFPFE